MNKLLNNSEIIRALLESLSPEERERMTIRSTRRMFLNYLRKQHRDDLTWDQIRLITDNILMS